MADTPPRTKAPAKPRSAAKAAPKAAKAASLAAAAPETLRHQASDMVSNASAKARDYANTGKDKASDALDELAKMAGGIADTLDTRFGTAYGDFVRKAGDAVSGTAESLKGKNVDDLIDDARTFVREKPAVAIGAAAAVGFVLTRLFRAGSDDKA